MTTIEPNALDIEMEIVRMEREYDYEDGDAPFGYDDGAEALADALLSDDSALD